MTDLRTRYDRRADVLYVTTSRNGPAHAREADGIVWRYLDADDTLVGATILDFNAYWRDHMSDLINEMASHFRVPPTKVKDVLEEKIP